MSARVAHIHRYPVKGLTVQALPEVWLEAAQGLPEDRRFAIAHGASHFNSAQPEWHPKRQFIALVTDERLATLESAYDPATGDLILRRDGKKVARGNITTPLGRDLINQFLAAYFRQDPRGAPKLVEASGFQFTDCPDPLVSIINLASVRDIERVARAPVDPIRFRGNLLIEDAEPWVEFDWVGRRLTVGETTLAVVEPIQRCAATTVNPETAERDLNIPKLLQAGFGHTDCGIYARVLSGGTVSAGDAVTVLGD